MQTARYTANLGVTNLAQYTDAQVPGRTALMARSALLGGYATLLLGEGFCSMALDGGPEMTPAQVFTAAEAKFTEAITHATAANNASLLNAARVGRARTRLDSSTPFRTRATPRTPGTRSLSGTKKAASTASLRGTRR